MEYRIRPIEISDAKGVHAMRLMKGVYENTLGLPSNKLRDVEAFIENMSSDSHTFVAVTKNDDDKDIVIGMITLNASAHPRERHSATIGINVHSDYQGIGIGTKLMETVIDLADNWLMLIRVELGVYTDNERAIHVYEKFGFEKEGLKKMVAIRNGQYIDDYIMARINPAYKK